MNGLLRYVKSLLTGSTDLISDDNPDGRTGLIGIAAVILIIAAAFAAHMSLLSKSPFPSGSDGYIFLVQARSLLEGKGLHYQDPSLFYLILTPLDAVAGPVNALRISIAIISSMCAAGIFLLARADGRSVPEQVCATAWGAFSPAGFFFCAQYPKQFLGVAFFILFMYSLRSRRIVYAVLFLVGAILSHRFSAALALIFIVPYFLRKIGRGRAFRVALLAGTVLLVSAAVIVTVPGTLSLEDFSRLELNRITFPVPPIVSFAKLYSTADGIHPLVIIDAALSLLVILRVLLLIIRGKRLSAWTVSLSVSALILSVPLFSFAEGGAGYRLYLATFPLSIALFAGTGFPARRAAYAMIIVLISAGVIHSRIDDFGKYDPPYGMYGNIALRTGSLIPQDTILVVAHRPLAETVDFILHIDTLAWRPESRFDRSRTWRIARDIDRWEITRSAGVSDNDKRIQELSARYLLVREDLWDSFLASIPRDNTDLVSRATGPFNPSAVRPPFITER